ncbi:MAG: hypothetical protein IKV85_00390 [Ruminococcus sp.]|nr:hypothetical protein [Ruminococcus sp.]
MKKLITFVLTAMCMTFAGAMTANAADTVNVGDTNGDGLINSADASEILSFYADVSVGMETVADEKFMAVSDINNDGTINSSDASHVLEYYGYISTIPENETPKGIREYLKNPVTTETVNYVLAPEGLDPGVKGSIQYIVNTAELVPHDDIPLYNIKGDNIQGGLAYQSKTYYLTDNTKKILNDFAKEHFTDEMTNYDRLAYTWEWLHYNVDYATSWEAYSKISELSFSEACFVYKSGQCIQYNGAFAEMMAYMGYDVYMLEKWQHGLTGQHFMSEVNIGGVGYNTEVGERSYDNPATNYRWMWLFDSSKQEFFGVGQKKPTY